MVEIEVLTEMRQRYIEIEQCLRYHRQLRRDLKAGVSGYLNDLEDQLSQVYRLNSGVGVLIDQIGYPGSETLLVEFRQGFSHLHCHLGHALSVVFAQKEEE